MSLRLLMKTVLICTGLAGCLSTGDESRSLDEKKIEEPKTINYCNHEVDSIQFDTEELISVEEVLSWPRTLTSSPMLTTEFISGNYPSFFGYTITAKELQGYIEDKAIWRVKYEDDKPDICSFIFFLENFFDGTQQYVFLINVDLEDQFSSVYLMASNNLHAECMDQMNSTFDEVGRFHRTSQSSCFYEDETSQGSEVITITDSLVIDFYSQSEKIISSDTVSVKTPLPE